MFTSPKEALRHLIQTSEESIKLAIRTPGLVELRNGIRYSQVEVTMGDGTQYGISAYDGEAVELYELAREYERRMITPLIA